MNHPKVILCLALTLGIFLRLVSLGSIPAGFTPDEASQAYTAYSILHTGLDEWGNSPGIASFKSFLDYKAPLQTYLMIPSIAVFGLNEFAARIPSALFGILAIFAVYLLCLELFPKTKLVAPVAALFLVISPWHLQFSRMALEVNLTSFLIPLGLYFFLKGLRNHKALIWTAILFGVGLYSYHAARIFIPLFSLALVIIYHKELFRDGLKTLLIPAIVFLIFVSPIAIDMVIGGSAKRGNDLMITNFSLDKIKSISDSAYYSELKTINPIVTRLFHNKVGSFLTQFTENYLSYLSLPFWFTEGGRETTYSVIPGRGLLYFWMLPFVLYGLFLIVTKRAKEETDSRIFLAWLFLAIIPAALTKEGYRPNRVGSLLCFWEIIAAFGFLNLLNLKFKFKKLITVSFAVIAIVLTGFYFEDYFANTKVTIPKSLSFGWREAVGAITPIEANYSNVMVEQGTQSQSFIAFYQKIDPKVFQKAAKVWATDVEIKQVNYLDQMDRYRLDKYTFGYFNWPEDKNLNTLYLWQGRAMLPEDRHTIHQVKTPTGELIMEVFDFRK